MALMSGTLMGAALMDLIGGTTSRLGPRLNGRAAAGSSASVQADLTIRKAAAASLQPVDRPGGAGLTPRLAAAALSASVERTSGAIFDRQPVSDAIASSPAKLQLQRDVPIESKRAELQGNRSSAIATADMQPEAAAAITNQASVKPAAAGAIGRTKMAHQAAHWSIVAAGRSVAAEPLHQVGAPQPSERRSDGSITRTWSTQTRHRQLVWQLGYTGELQRMTLGSVFHLPIAGGAGVERSAIAFSNNLVDLATSTGADLSTPQRTGLFDWSPAAWRIEPIAAWSPLVGLLEIAGGSIGQNPPIRWTPLLVEVNARLGLAAGSRISTRLAASGGVWRGFWVVGGSIAAGAVSGQQTLHLELAAGATAFPNSYLELARAGERRLAAGGKALLQLAAAVHFQEEILALGPQLDRRRLALAAGLDRPTPRYGASPIAAALRAYASTWSTARSGGKISPRPLAQLVSGQADQFRIGRERLVQAIAGNANAAAPVWRFGIAPRTRSQAMEYFTRSITRSGSRMAPSSLAELVDRRSPRIDVGWRLSKAPRAYSSTFAQPAFRIGVVAQAIQQFQVIQLAQSRIGPLLIAPPDLYYRLADDLIAYELLDRFALYQLPSDLVGYELLDRFGLYELPADLLQFVLLDRFPWYRLPKE